MTVAAVLVIGSMVAIVSVNDAEAGKRIKRKL